MNDDLRAAALAADSRDVLLRALGDWMIHVEVGPGVGADPEGYRMQMLAERLALAKRLDQALASPDRILAICEELDAAKEEVAALRTGWGKHVAKDHAAAPSFELALTDLVKWADRFSKSRTIEDELALATSLDEARAALEGKPTE